MSSFHRLHLFIGFCSSVSSTVISVSDIYPSVLSARRFLLPVCPSGFLFAYSSVCRFFYRPSGPSHVLCSSVSCFTNPLVGFVRPSVPSASSIFRMFRRFVGFFCSLVCSIYIRHRVLFLFSWSASLSGRGFRPPSQFRPVLVLLVATFPFYVSNCSYSSVSFFSMYMHSVSAISPSVPFVRRFCPSVLPPPYVLVQFLNPSYSYYTLDLIFVLVIFISFLLKCSYSSVSSVCHLTVGSVFVRRFRSILTYQVLF